MQQSWPLVLSDFRREYGMDGHELARLSVDEFRWLLQGLSGNSRFQRAWAEAPKNLYDQSDIDAVTAAARR